MGLLDLVCLINFKGTLVMKMSLRLMFHPIYLDTFQGPHFLKKICEIKLSSSLESDFAVIRMKPP